MSLCNIYSMQISNIPSNELSWAVQNWSSVRNNWRLGWLKKGQLEWYFEQYLESETSVELLNYV